MQHRSFCTKCVSTAHLFMPPPSRRSDVAPPSLAQAACPGRVGCGFRCFVDIHWSVCPLRCCHTRSWALAVGQRFGSRHHGKLTSSHPPAALACACDAAPPPRHCAPAPQPPPPPPLEVKGKAVWILHVLVNATHHRRRNTSGGPKPKDHYSGLVDLHSRKGTGRAKWQTANGRHHLQTEKSTMASGRTSAPPPHWPAQASTPDKR